MEQQSIPVVASAIKDRLIVAAIDFGTTYSGYAYSFYHDFREDPLRITTNYWDRTTSTGLSHKAPSTVLFNPKQEFHSFGYEAEDKYNKLTDDRAHYDWYCFTTFKMLLYNAQERPLGRRTMLRDVYGKEMCAMDVFTAAIKALKDHLIATLTAREANVQQDKNDQQVPGNISDLIHWVLTVPAIWDDAAKQFMRESAIHAEINTGNLTLALEPEVASLYCQYLPIDLITTENGRDIRAFPTGTKYLVLDAGGGTIDITVHKVDSDRTLRELHKANGGDWGGISINKAFEELLMDILGEDVYEMIKMRSRDDFIFLQKEIETKKRKVTPTDIGKIRFALPFTVFNAYRQIHSSELKNKTTATLRDEKQISFKVDGDKLCINANKIQGLFEPTCENIIEQVREVLAHQNVQGTDTIMLVGGFAESMMLRDAIKSAFPQTRLIIPQDAGLAVLKGAVLYGHKPESVISRMSKYTYGIEAYKTFEPGIDKQEKRTELHGYVLCKNHFSKHAEINKEYMPCHSFGEQKYVPSEPGQRELTISVYRSSLRYPLYVDQEESTKVGDMKVTLDDVEGGINRPVSVKMVFGDTELGIEAKEEKTGRVTTAKYDFLS